MSKADELGKKMAKPAPVNFTPRQSVDVRPLPTAPVESAITPSPKAEPTPKKAAKGEVATLFAKIPREEKLWVDHYRVDTGKELSEIATEAIKLLRKQVERNK